MWHDEKDKDLIPHGVDLKRGKGDGSAWRSREERTIDPNPVLPGGVPRAMVIQGIKRDLHLLDWVQPRVPRSMAFSNQLFPAVAEREHTWPSYCASPGRTRSEQFLVQHLWWLWGPLLHGRLSPGQKPAQQEKVWNPEPPTCPLPSVEPRTSFIYVIK